MTYAAETFTLRDGNMVTIRSVEPEDAAIMLQYMKNRTTLKVILFSYSLYRILRMINIH